ncbi:DUF4097 family beta strand repeat-containing protein [Nocardioides sp.]|uniref:DUF4097 family beta strand repeat-containing protein n=1 Tax=Nocardioides sp. TaxID=35761 RepID=UPI002718C098|nr:DUF4097 family beta strand repeat-containing protein [Nocardioides sp.]MDO9454680.1 DUF4097 family beta strand repeat-containing protein [Nocardioides sp.]
MTDHHFETHEPIELYVENGKGLVEVHATDTTETRVELSGPDAEETRVELEGTQLSVIAPQHRGGFLGGDRRLDIVVTLPTLSDVVTKLGSADLRATGTVGGTQVRSGSGDVSLETLGGACLIETGSGDVRVERAEQALRIKSGSGDVGIGTAAAEVSVSTGSGDVQITDAAGPTAVKTGSGDLLIGRAHTDVGLTTGSGDLEIQSVSSGRVQVKGASGDVRVGVPAGVPVWTDVSTVSGRIHSTLEGAGQPEPGADHVELRAKTVSGDIVLTQL